MAAKDRKDRKKKKPNNESRAVEASPLLKWVFFAFFRGYSGFLFWTQANPDRWNCFSPEGSLVPLRVRQILAGTLIWTSGGLLRQTFWSGGYRQRFANGFRVNRLRQFLRCRIFFRRLQLNRR